VIRKQQTVSDVGKTPWAYDRKQDKMEIGITVIIVEELNGVHSAS
jgi:hypothetical protein